MTDRLAAGSVAAALIVALGPARAAAGEPMGARLTVDPCVDADAAKVRRLFLIELTTSLATERARESATGRAERAAAGTRVKISCDGDLIELRVHDPITGKSLIRRISPPRRTGRERLLALAIMELLVASWIELEATPEPVTVAVDTVVDDEAKDSARQVVRRRLPRATWTTSATLLGAASWSAPPNSTVRGGMGIRVVRDRAGGLGWSADVLAQSASQTLPEGTVATRSLAASAVVHARRDLGRAAVRAGVGARLGAVSVSGQPAQPRSVLGSDVTGMSGGPLLRLDADIRLLRGLTLALSAESGYHALAVRGLVDGRERAAVQGAWLGGQVGVGWTW